VLPSAAADARVAARRANALHTKVRVGLWVVEPDGGELTNLVADAMRMPAALDRLEAIQEVARAVGGELPEPVARCLPLGAGHG
jgi:hypothetical protein